MPPKLGERSGLSRVHYSQAALSASKDIIMIDLSDTTNFPHSTATGSVVITKMCISIQTDGTFGGSFEIGYLANVDATNGDLYTFQKYPLGASQTVVEHLSATPDCPIICDIDHILTQAITADDTAFQDDVVLPSPFDDAATYTTKSGDGDIALRVTRSAGSLVFNTSIQYYVK